MRIAPVLLLLVAGLSHAEPAWVLASQLNVRDKPNARGALLYVAKAGERCELLGPDAPTWSKVSCSGFVGVTKTEFLGKEAPTLATAKAQFREAWGAARAQPPAEDPAAYASQGKLYDQAMSLAQRYAQLGGPGAELKSFLEDLFLFQAASPRDPTPVRLDIERHCPDIDGCQRAALQHTRAGVRLAEFSARPHYAAVYELKDGSFWLMSGGFSSDDTFLAVVDQHLTLSAALASALGSTTPDACPMWAPQGLLCAGPSGCEGPTRQCHTCKLACGSACNTCRLGCKPSKYDACAGSCTGAYSACVDACSKALADAPECAAKK